MSSDHVLTPVGLSPLPLPSPNLPQVITLSRPPSALSVHSSAHSPVPLSSPISPDLPPGWVIEIDDQGDRIYRLDDARGASAIGIAPWRHDTTQELLIELTFDSPDGDEICIDVPGHHAVPLGVSFPLDPTAWYIAPLSPVMSYALDLLHSIR